MTAGLLLDVDAELLRVATTIRALNVEFVKEHASKILRQRLPIEDKTSHRSAD